MAGESSIIFLGGDVMTGRGIDQILAHPSAPHIYEPYLKDARGYLRLAEQARGPITTPADFGYVWGEAFSIWDKMAPDLRIINLETSVTTSEDYWKGKGINYRMHPGNIPCLARARIDACSLANNHVLDWGYSGLEETLGTLREAGIKTAGAGRDLTEAAAPARLEVPGKGVLYLFSFGLDTSGIPPSWGATGDRPGVNLLPNLSPATLSRVAGQIKSVKRKGDVVIASIHWGGNWGFEITPVETQFAHGLIEEAGVDIVHGHSSHHVKAIEVHRGRLVLYGCGDLVNDYEGIFDLGFGIYRGDVGAMYFVTVDAATGELARLSMIATTMRRFRVEYAPTSDTAWLRDTLNREGKRFGTSVQIAPDGTLVLNR